MFPLMKFMGVCDQRNRLSLKAMCMLQIHLIQLQKRYLITCRSYNKTYGLKVTTSNCSNNYKSFPVSEKSFSCLINILQGTVAIFGDGSQIRDWLHVTDHCRGIELIIAKGTIGQTYNIGGDNEWKNIDVVTLICNTMNDLFKASRNLKTSFPQSPCARDEDAKSLITYVEDRLGHDIRYAIDATRIKIELNYSPAMTFERV